MAHPTPTRTGKPSDLGHRVSGIMQWLNRHPALLPLLLGLVALALGSVNLGRWGLFGDEYNSLEELTRPGLQPHSSVFFFLLHIWAAIGGQSAEWLRLLSVFCAAGAAIAVYFAALEGSRSTSAALGAGLVAATSAWRVEEGQEVRFYAYFILCGALFLWSLLRAVRRPTRLNVSLLVVFSLAAITAHLLGVLFVATGLIFGQRFLRVRTRWLLLLGLCGVCVLVGAFPSAIPGRLLQFGYQSILPLESRLNRPDQVYIGPRGPSWGTALKPAYSAYTYLVGTSLYPLDLGLSIPVVLTLGVAALLGLWHLRHQRELVLLLVAWAVLPAILVFVTFDSLAPAGYTAAAARHVAPIAVGLWVAIGALADSRRWRVLFLAALIANGVGLLAYYTSDWSLSSRKDFDVLSAVRRVREAGCSGQAALVADGRMYGVANAYLAGLCDIREIHGFLQSGPAQAPAQLTLFYSSETSDTARVVPELQVLLTARGYGIRNRWQDGPAVVEQYMQEAPLLLQDGQLPLPWSVPPLPFGSLRLPIASAARPGTAIFGAVVMQSEPTGEWSVSLAPGLSASGLTLTSSVFELQGNLAGTIEVVSQGHVVMSHEVLAGQQTAEWDSDTCMDCRVAFTWHKRLDTLGRSAYPGAWADFTARGFAWDWDWGETRTITEIRFRVPNDYAGEWWIWQVVPHRAG